MIVLDQDSCPQGSAQWKAERCGLPTASKFSKIVTPKGAFSKSSRAYMCELIAERLTGEPEDHIASDWILRGIEMEEQSIAYYELQKDVEVRQVGLCLTDDRRVGCSPDGLVDPNGGLEIKNPKATTHIGYLLAPDDNYKCQVQGAMWVCEREWWDFLSHYEGLPPVLVRAHRNEEFISKLEAGVTEFCDKLDEAMENLPAGFKVEKKENPGSDLRAMAGAL